MGAVVLQQAVSVAPSWLDYASDLVRAASALAFVCLLSWVTLRALAARGFGKSATGKRMEVLERLSLDGQRSLWLVRVERRRLLVGVGDRGAPQLIAELNEGQTLDTALATPPDDLSSLLQHKSDAHH